MVDELNGPATGYSPYTVSFLSCMHYIPPQAAALNKTTAYERCFHIEPTPPRQCLFKGIVVNQLCLI
jgi:hypothetical protein